MRDMIIGVIAAALLLGGLFALSKYDPPANRIPTPENTAAKVERGFVGTKQIGPWVLECAPATNRPLADNSFGRCRANLVYRRKEDPKQIVLLMSLRLLGPQQRLAMLVIMPPIAKPGDQLELHAGKRLLKLPVTVCRAGRCVALVALAPRGETDLLSEHDAVLVFPPSPDGKRGGVPVPFTSMQDAVGAMRRAEAA